MKVLLLYVLLCRGYGASRIANRSLKMLAPPVAPSVFTVPLAFLGMVVDLRAGEKAKPKVKGRGGSDPKNVGRSPLFLVPFSLHRKGFKR